MVDLIKWDPDQPAQFVNDHILLSPGVSYAFVVTSDDGDVVINTGMPSEGKRHRERFEQLLGRPLNVRKIVLTQSHPDHLGGWRVFAGPDTEIIVQRQFPDLWEERQALAPFFAPRVGRVIASAALPSMQRAAWHGEVEAVVNPTLFGDRHSFEVGNRRFELYSTPSGETLDNVVVHLPEEGAAFTGNLMGALPGSLPHFYTLRGDRDRSLVRFIKDMDLLIGFHLTLLINGHGEPIRGQAVVAAYLEKLRDAVRYIRDQTIKGMVAHKSLPTLMREIQLPDSLQHLPGRGRLSWYVRAMWEELTGPYRLDSLTEIYEVPQRDLWADMVELAGADRLVERARAYVSDGKPVHALHLTDLVLAGDSTHRQALETEITALEALIEEGRGRFFDVQGFLETELERARHALGV